jgi:hypothetical protein
MEEEVEELCAEGLATHGDPESCVDGPRGRGEGLLLIAVILPLAVRPWYGR